LKNRNQRLQKTKSTTRKLDLLFSFAEILHWIKEATGTIARMTMRLDFSFNLAPGWNANSTIAAPVARRIHFVAYIKLQRGELTVACCDPRKMCAQKRT
jgi:hypothetical protein